MSLMGLNICFKKTIGEFLNFATILSYVQRKTGGNFPVSYNLISVKFSKWFLGFNTTSFQSLFYLGSFCLLVEL